jgi:Pyruvate/2-oxoacid:ferredoxin oxidoreductase delta subunit
VNRLTAPILRVLLYEGPGSRSLSGDFRGALLRTLLERGFPVSCVRSAGLIDAAANGVLLVIGDFEKDPPAATPQVRFQHLDGTDPVRPAEFADQVRTELGLERPGTWKPWFPVIDFSRCTNCMQCLSFCLFDVYGVSTTGGIEVRNQDNCKTDCPACSRVCPEVAIMFPKYRHGPINGEEISADDVRREAMKVDISALLGGDIYSMLRDRSARAKSRFSKERDDERALKERQNCLVKAGQALGVPAEVLASLPSPEEIQARSQQAQARARAALEMNQSKLGENAS